MPYVAETVCSRELWGESGQNELRNGSSHLVLLRTEPDGPAPGNSECSCLLSEQVMHVPDILIIVSPLYQSRDVARIACEAWIV